jgi:hypothetical protein
MQALILTVYIVGLVTSSILLKLMVGPMPVRMVIMLALFFILLLAYSRVMLQFFRLHYPVVLLFIYVACVGTAVTYANGATPAELVEANLRSIIQPFTVLVAIYVLNYAVGYRVTAAVIIGLVLVHCVIATLQFLGQDFAWAMRAVLGRFQDENQLTQAMYRLKARAMGLAHSPIDFAYTVVSGYIIVVLLQHSGLLSLRIALISKFIILVGAISSETRSLLLGIVVSEFLFFLLQGRLRNYLVLFGLAVIGYLVFTQLGAMDSRIASAEDQSAQGRLVLYTFGFHLFFDNPFGLGWGFTPGEYAWLYWEYLAGTGKADVAFRLELHNSYLNYLLVYGIVGVVPIVVLFFLYPTRFVVFAIFFSSYFVNAALHNAGVFVGSLQFWWAVAFYLYVRDHNLLQIKLPLRQRAASPGGRPRPFIYQPSPSRA